MFVPIVVLANPKTVINNRFAKKAVKEKVIKADQLIQYIKNAYNKSNSSAFSDSDTKKWAESFLQKNCENKTDYKAKYGKYIISENTVENNVTFEEMFNELKAYRLKMSRQENIKPYYIYNDKQLKELIDKKPKTLNELQQVSGFGEKKAEKYGKDILQILSRI
ncbi:MAG: HRDC domain-containing protein [Eubacterium sp.]|nr:HRDC domain-containing protein [Eubacterium sp.]